jgi:hypothetical protein
LITFLKFPATGSWVIRCALAVNVACVGAWSQDNNGSENPSAPAFLYNTLGQPWQATDPGRWDWESTLGLGAASSSPGSVQSASGALLLSARSGLKPWCDAGILLGGAQSEVDAQSSGSMLGGFTFHAAAGLGNDKGLALYLAPVWTWSEGDLASTSASLTAVFGHEPDAGWAQDFNLVAGYSDHGAFGAAQSPDLDDLWSFSALASLANTQGDGAFAYSGEAFATYSRGDFQPDAGGVDEASAWRLGGGIGCQKNWGADAKGVKAFAAYAGFQWERCEIPGQGDFTTPSLVVNLSLGASRARR